MEDNITWGTLGEDLAEATLIRSGYTIIERNYRCPMGEIDIIASKDDEIIYAEVKTRKGQAFGQPCEAVGTSKKRHMRMAALSFQSQRNISLVNQSFCVIEIGVNVIKNAF